MKHILCPQECVSRRGTHLHIQSPQVKGKKKYTDWKPKKPNVTRWYIKSNLNHRGAVLSVVMSSTGEQCFSGGIDGTIQCWNTPNPNIDPYDSYGKRASSFSVWMWWPFKLNHGCWPVPPHADPSMLRGALCGHTDSVWGLVYSSAHQRLLSCSADGTVRLWDANTTSPALAVLNEDKSSHSELVSWFVFCFFFFLLGICFGWMANMNVPSFLCTRTWSSLLSRPGVQRTGPPGRILHWRADWAVQHGDSSAGPQSGVHLWARYDTHGNRTLTGWLEVCLEILWSKKW